MQQNSLWEQFYNNTPLDKIPWQSTQADYLTKVIEARKIKPGLALDLGCGTGIKSIYLAQNGFSVTGVDISKTAIEHANQNAIQANIKVEFYNADATDLSFLKEKKFDFVLDWANLHGVPEDLRATYVNQIASYCKTGGKFVLRCFSDKDTTEKSVTRPMGKIYLFSREDIEGLFGKYFKILETNQSSLSGLPRTQPNKWFDEYLMERK